MSNDDLKKGIIAKGDNESKIRNPKSTLSKLAYTSVRNSAMSTVSVGAKTPESVLLGTMSNDKSKDRMDRTVATPWLTYGRVVSYQQIVQQAPKLSSLKHYAKVEFRHLCETLRLHLANATEYSCQPHSITLSDPDTLQHHSAVELKLWQETFGSAKDICNLFTMVKMLLL
ncbi:hypothetical protein ARMGADRAFT_1035588 [Armillaria gallica]|uniref:eIF3a PCI domain-containing protein n=1 Tax=Armillaria gallica TaxID=47427 RepID=A0A2H3DDT6_ARMGA|nr:hypothetical protein ARMGADRAFT_1035588 [Armillaria gallica]